MAQFVTLGIEDGVAVISVSSPPANVLDAPLRRELAGAFDEALADENVLGIVLEGAGRGFPTGEDVAEPEAEPVPPPLAEICKKVEEGGKPVAAVLRGVVLGGGAELALAAHYRFADQGARLALPGVALGLLPSAGGIQRLTRIVGPGDAISILVSGQRIPMTRARTLGIVDSLSADDPGAAARAFLRGAKARPRPTMAREDGLSDPPRFLETVAAARRRLAEDAREVPRRIVDCVEVALLLPGETALAYEEAAAEEARASAESGALRHVWQAERMAARPLDESHGFAPPRTLGVSGLWGAGPRAARLLAALLETGRPVVLSWPDEAALADTLSSLERLHDRAVSAGRLEEGERGRREARLAADTSPRALEEAQIVLEAAPGNSRDREEALARLDAALAPGVIIATVSGAAAPGDQDMERLSAQLSRPAEAIGLHVPFLVGDARLMEVVETTASGGEAVSTGMALVRAMGRIAIWSGGVDESIAEAVAGAGFRAADWLVGEGASLYAVDRALRDWGFRLGPFQAMDRMGLDRFWRRDATGEEAGWLGIGDALCEAGRFGRRAGRGYYVYRDGGAAEDPDLLAIAAAARARRGLHPREVGSEEIVTVTLDAMANAGARLLDRGIARSPADIDLAAIHSGGFPRRRGGPMKAADIAGLLPLRGRLAALAEATGQAFWAPSPRFEDLIKNGRDFGSLNEREGGPLVLRPGISR